MRDDTVAAVGRRPALATTLAVVAALVGLNVAGHLFGWESVWLGPVGATALLAFARWSGLSWHQLGLGRGTYGRGLRWGAGVVGVVGAIYLGGVLIPATRTAFLDVRYHMPASGALLTAFVVIPLGTVLLEEVAFRSVLWGVLSRHARAWQVLLTSSVLFGLWHVFPAMAAVSNEVVGSALAGLGSLGPVVLVVGTVLFTACGGLVAGELRRRTGSVLAAVGMHWATNALGVLFGVFAWHLAT
ncbi:MAG TPA: CPBP family intramembrane glutamic endopeptidase [Candidatus Lustribacter sp.]|nr:CPBP family intramembrane glutamic endopeptidase [Candidatus Lustribacter sp.]